jgi:hypothetical protein
MDNNECVWKNLHKMIKKITLIALKQPKGWLNPSKIDRKKGINLHKNV